MIRFVSSAIGYLFGLGAVFGLIAAAAVGYFITQMSGDLPDVDQLRHYAPPVMTRIHAADGSLVAEYARERRLFLPIQAIPDVVKDAFISAEDKTFYVNNGLDFAGIFRAAMTNLRNHGSDKRPIGASTITQQVAKNFLLTNQVSYIRKIKEAILALRIDATFTKAQVLELYLNQIYLGMGAYGIAAAALTYFNKSVQELTIAEAAYLAALPKGPSNYNPFRHPERAVERRDWVIDQMAQNGYITQAEADAAKSEPLKVHPSDPEKYSFASEYFAEEVRRELVSLYGDQALYGGGLSVRTSLDPDLQVMARKALMDGLQKFDVQRSGWRGPVTTVDVVGGQDWGAAIANVDRLWDVPEWSVAVVLSVDANEAIIGLQPDRLASGALSTERKRGRIAFSDVAWRRGKRGKEPYYRTMSRMTDVLKPGDVVYVQAVPGKDGAYALRQVPKVSGGMVVMDPHTGRVLAMVGGFSFAESQFNRATQAYRQPGSSFKPIIYAAALDNGYTPSSIILDEPITIDPGYGQPPWRPKNYGGGFLGPTTLRVGLERSRNVMTVRLAKDLGMPLIAQYAERFGVYDHLAPILPMALGAGETTVFRMVGAYSIIANGGQQIKPTLIDRIQDRYGRTIFKHDKRKCPDCNVASWHNQPDPTVIDDRDYILDPMTAYQVTSLMEGVVQHGTGVVVRALGRPVAGKTGTTNDEKDAWFVGFTPDLVAGVYVGYDQPAPLGAGATGGVIAAPIFLQFMQQATAGTPPLDFPIPPGIKLVPVDHHTGREVSYTGPGVIMEAFKPGTAPGDSVATIGLGQSQGAGQQVTPESQRAVLSGSGGLY